MPEPRQLFSPPRNPTLTSRDLLRRPTGSRLQGQGPTPTGQPIDFGFTVTPSPSAAAVLDPVVNRAPGRIPLARPRRISAFGYAADQSYRAPQQTERVNPLTGDNPSQPPGTTSPLQRPPFIQRGLGVPQGQDVAGPAPDNTVGGSMQGTFGRLRGKTPITGGTGAFSRKFTNPTSAGLYDQFSRRLFA